MVYNVTNTSHCITGLRYKKVLIPHQLPSFFAPIYFPIFIDFARMPIVIVGRWPDCEQGKGGEHPPVFTLARCLLIVYKLHESCSLGMCRDNIYGRLVKTGWFQLGGEGDPHFTSKSIIHSLTY